jgi:hypothetical protein
VLEAELPARAEFARCDCGWGGPGAVSEAGDDEAGAEAEGAHHAEFEDAEDDETLWMLSLRAC